MRLRRRKQEIRQTSLEAYRELLNLGEKEREVYNAIVSMAAKDGPPTDREITAKLGYQDPNKVRPRRYELLKKGWIMEAGKRKCNITGKMALTWRPTEW